LEAGFQLHSSRPQAETILTCELAEIYVSCIFVYEAEL
jgi:hypothetical protein